MQKGRRENGETSVQFPDTDQGGRGGGDAERWDFSSILRKYSRCLLLDNMLSVREKKQKNKTGFL